MNQLLKFKGTAIINNQTEENFLTKHNKVGRGTDLGIAHFHLVCRAVQTPDLVPDKTGKIFTCPICDLKVKLSRKGRELIIRKDAKQR